MKTKQPVESQNPRARWRTKSEDGGSNSSKRPRYRRAASRPSSRSAPATAPARGEQTVAAAVVAANGHSSRPVTGIESIDYKGHTLRIDRFRSGWKVSIFHANSPFALQRIPLTSDFNAREAVIAEAKSIVDGRSEKMTAPEIPVEPVKPVDVSPAEELDLLADLLKLRGPLTQWCTRTASALKRIYFSIDIQSKRA